MLFTPSSYCPRCANWVPTPVGALYQGVKSVLDRYTSAPLPDGNCQFRAETMTRIGIPSFQNRFRAVKSRICGLKASPPLMFSI